MRGFRKTQRRDRAKRVIFACSMTMAMLIATVASVGVISETAVARGPEYSGPETQGDGPAYFGPAPNPFPYCDSPTYFDPFPENINPIGRMDVGDGASVTTDGVTMNLVITDEGNEDTQYPGFFPQGGDGGGNDQAKGIELAEGDTAQVTLSAPLFYSQWIFTDVDQPNEGFTVTPTWTVPGQAAAFGGDNNFTFAGTSNLAVALDDTNGESERSEAIEGRVQVDFLGAVTGITMERTFPSNGQSGFAVGGGCEAAGAAKVVTSGPTWNGTSFDVTYDLRMRNNLPSSATIQAVINDAVRADGASTVTGTPQGIALTDLQLTDDLRDPAFSNIEVIASSATGNLDLNEDFDGINDLELLDGGSIDAESDEVITLSVQYTPDLSTTNWDDCQAGYTYLNQTEITGSAANVTVADMSDDGVSAAPSDNNGAGGVDDPTPVTFPCPPGGLEIVKTAVAGANGTCPTFENGTPGDGAALQLTVDDVVTYCVSVRNPGPGPIFNVVVTDPQAPNDYTLNDLNAGETDTVSYDVRVDLSTPPQNTATATADDSSGTINPVRDTALIEVSPKDQPLLEIVKTVVEGANGTCPSFGNGVVGLGAALAVDDGDTVTYCISVRNVGPGDAQNVVIRDDQAPQDFNVGTLATGEGATESYDITVNLNTTKVNVATASYSGPDGPREPVDDNAQIDVLPLQPNLEIVKTVIPGPGGTCPTFANGVPGLGAALAVDDRDTVTYCVSVRNTGVGVATDVVVNDTQAPNPLPIGQLGAGEGDTVSYDVVVGLNTPEINTATATGNGPDGALTPVSDRAQIAVDALPDPNIEIVKTAVRGPNGTCPSFDNGIVGLGDPVQFLDGEVVTYCISIRNSGAGAATSVVITDTQAPNTFDLNIGDLAAGESQTRSYDITVTVQTPTINTARATGNGLNGPVTPVSDPAEIAVSSQPNPILEIVKTVVPGPDGTCPSTFAEGTPGDGAAEIVAYGDTVTYCITVRNVGQNPATNVIVTDAQAPGPASLGTIAVGAEVSTSYDVEVTDSTPLKNTATARGQGPNGPVAPVSDTAVLAADDAVLGIVKTVVPGPAGDCPAFSNGVVGEGDALPVQFTETVTYCLTIQNSGGNAATGVTITDPQAPEVYDIGTLPAGAVRTRSYDVVVNAATPTRNVATVSGQGPNGSIGPLSDPANIRSTPLPDPALAIVKTVVAGPNGTCPSFDNGVAGPGDALTVLLDGTVTYCVAIRNTGAGDAVDVRITDDQATNSPFIIGDLASGQEQSVQYDVVVGLSTPLTNTAVVTGTGPNGPTPPADDDAVIALDTRVANISLIHSVSKATDECLTVAKSLNSLVANSENLPITWCAQVTNTGNVPLVNVVLTAPAIGDGQPVDVLAVAGKDILLPGETAFVPVAGEIPDTGLISAAAVVGDPADTDGNVISGIASPRDDDNAEVREASINLETTVVTGVDGDCADATEVIRVPVGSDVTWCFAVTNTGAVDLLVTEVTDPALGVTATIPENLRRIGPNVTVVVSANDVSEGEVTIDGDVKGKPLDFDGTILDQAPEVEDVDPARIEIPAADLAIVKSVSDAGPVEIGAQLTYTLVITNAGPDAATGVKVTDELPVGIVYESLPADADWACSLDAGERGFSCLKASPIANGASVTLTYTARTTAAAPADTALVNTARVSSETPDPDPTDNEDTSTTRTPPPDEVIPTRELPEYPGPFTPPAPPLQLPEPDEVLGLAITGAASNLLVLLSAAMLATGGLFTVGARRRDTDL